MEIQKLRNYVRNRKYMAGVERDKLRVKKTGEFFTPTWLVQNSIAKIEQFDLTAFSNPTNTFIDPACGDGNLIAEALLRKLESLNKEIITDTEFKIALSTIYGVDLMPDNVKLCREFLLFNNKNAEFQDIVNKNILVGNTLDPLADIPGQTKLDRTRMKELFYKTDADMQAEYFAKFDFFE
jgi:type I restriction-modification system DNA methylase subunit